MTFTVLGTREQMDSHISIHKLNIPRKPKVYPDIHESSCVIAEFNRGIDVVYIYCPDLTAMQEIYEKYYWGEAKDLCWYMSNNASDFITT